MNKERTLAGVLIVATTLTCHSAPSDRTGKVVVDTVCAECHLTGKKGAPKIGDAPAWSDRAIVGMESLSNHAIKGYRKMPAHGGKGNVTDLELGRAINYMIHPVTGVPEINTPISSPVTMSGQEVVAAKCVECHLEGKKGAPRMGVMSDWAPRLQKGLPEMVLNAIHGHKQMPARGGLASLSDAEMRSAATYMMTAKKNHPTMIEKER
jgi:cytochrome c5